MSQHPSRFVRGHFASTFIRPRCRVKSGQGRRARLKLMSLEERATPTTFPVLNANDSGVGSFRQAITDANNNAGADEIVFDATVFATPQTINLTSALPQISNGDLTVIGTGAANVIVNRSSGTFGIFSIASSSPNVIFDGITIQGGNSGNGSGITNSAATNLTVRNSVVTGNTGGRGAIYMANGSTGLLTIQNTTISGNTGTTGGIYFYFNGSLLVQNSTISGNTGTANDRYNAGGIMFFGNIGAGGFTIENSTIHGNTSASATVGGGGVGVTTLGTLTIRNSTITGNTAPAAAIGGGGVGFYYAGAGGPTINIINSVVAQNTGPADGPDVRTDAGGNTVITSSLIGVVPPANFTDNGGNLFGSSGSPLNPQLGPLQNNGGLTNTRLPLAGSPVIDAGSNALLPTGMVNDQRGFGFVRSFNGTVDMGSVEVQPVGVPTAVATTTDVGQANDGETIYTFSVTFADPTGPNRGIDVDSIIGENDTIRVTGPGGFSQLATFVSIDNPTDGEPRTVTYSITPPGGAWDGFDSGQYLVHAEAGQVVDFDGIFVQAGVIGSFTVAISQTFIVTTDADSGTGSLREALAAANASPAHDFIEFDPAFFNTQRTIALTDANGPLIVEDDLTINGPGASLLTVQRDTAATTNFFVFGSLAPVLNMSGFTVRNGVSQDFIGGGLVSAGVGNNITLDRMVFSGNSATGNGFGIGSGGAIGLGPETFLTVRNSTISGNTAEHNGGGIYFYSGGSLVIENSTISGNTTTSETSAYGYFYAGGGGVYFFGQASPTPPSGFTPGTLVIRNSTIANNTSAATGGGINLIAFSGTLLVQNSTISGNRANTSDGGNAYYGGGGIHQLGFGAISVVNSIVSGNLLAAGSTAVGPDIRSASGTVSTRFSAIGDVTGFTESDGTGNLPPGTNLLLGPLANNGGPTQTMAPLPGSPLIDAGSNADVPIDMTTDQLGSVHDRIFGTVDIGAYEVQPPQVTINQAAGQADPTNGTIVFDVVFDVSVTGFTGTDVSFAGSTVGGTLQANVTGSGTTYTVTVTGMDGEGTVVASIPAGVAFDGSQTGNEASTSTDNSVFFDNVGSAVTINQAAGQPEPTNAATLFFDVVFAEAVTGFSGSDVSFAGSTVGGTLVANVVQNSATSYTVEVTGMSGEGTVVASIPAGGAQDFLGNGNLASTSSDNSILFDGQGPLATINQGATQVDPTTGTTIVFDLVFSEPAFNFDASDISFAGSTVGGTLVANVIQLTPTTYTVEVTGMFGFGTVVASIPAGAVNDALGNSGLASTSTDNSVTYSGVGTIGFKFAVFNADEETGTVRIFVSRTNGSDGPASVDFTVAVGSAETGDFSAPPTPHTLNWGNGITDDQFFDITITNDTLSEGIETIILTLSNFSAGAIQGLTTAEAIIARSDAVKLSPTLRVHSNLDFDGDRFTVKFGGKAGTADVYLTDGTGPISSIEFANTDPLRSSLTISVKKNKLGPPATAGMMEIGAVTGSGVKSLSAKFGILTEDLTLNGYLGSLTMAAVADDADITAGGTNTQKTKLNLGVVGDDVDIALGSSLSLLKATSVGDGSITVPSIGSIITRGDFESDITASGAGVLLGRAVVRNMNIGGHLVGSTINIDGTFVAGKPLLSSLKVKGNIVDSTIDVAGDVGLVSATSFTGSTLLAGYSGPEDGTGTFDVAATVKSFLIKGDNNAFSDSNVIASTFRNVSLRTIGLLNGGTPFGFYADNAINKLVYGKPVLFMYRAGDPDAQINDFVVKVV